MNKFKVGDFVVHERDDLYEYIQGTNPLSKIIEIFKEYDIGGLKRNMRVKIVGPKSEKGTYLVHSKYFKLVPKLKAILLSERL